MIGAVILLLLTALGGVRSRLLGGGFVHLPDLLKKAFEAADCALVLVAFAYLDTGSYLAYWEGTLAVFLITVFSCNMGHQDFYQMANNTNVIREQTASPIVKFTTWLVLRIQGQKIKISDLDRGSLLYDSIGMGWVGYAATLPLGIAVMIIGHEVMGGIIAVSGITNALAYYLGWYHLKGKLGLHSTEWGEWIRGFCRGGIRWACVLILYWGIL